MNRTRAVDARRLTLDEYHEALRSEWGDDAMQWRVECPSCGTIQCLQDFFDATNPQTADDKNALARLAGFSCIGRVTGATGAFNREKHKPCNYTSGGLFCINTLFVVREDGKETPAFAPATRVLVEAAVSA